MDKTFAPFRSLYDSCIFGNIQNKIVWKSINKYTAKKMIT